MLQRITIQELSISLRDRQSDVLNEIATALASDYKYIMIEAPTGPVAIAVALTLGTSYTRLDVDDY